MEEEDRMMSSSSSDSESDREDEGELAALVAEVAANPESYEAHEQYVGALRRAGQLEKLRGAREAMNALFPIPGKMWQEWAKDEANLLSGGEGDDISPVAALYERGLKEYLYVPLWLDYLEFVEERDPAVVKCSPEGLQKMRELYERAVTAAGIHATEGSRIWEAYREFEQAVLQAMADYPEDAEEKKKQASRVENLFHRQLAVPLKNHASTLQDYKDWENERGKDPDIPPAYKKSEASWLECKVFENSVDAGKPADGELLQNYMLYIDYEQNKSKIDPARIQILFERAVTVFPVSRELWLKYTNYLDHKLKVESVCKNVYARAVRNCPWVGELWKRYLLTLERFHCKDEEISQIFEQSLQRGFHTPEEYLDVFLTRVDGLRRQAAPIERLREVFQRASGLLSSFFPDFVDRSLRLHGYWARLEVRLAKDISAARAIWESLIKSLGWITQVWKGYINMELGLENIKEVRSLYKKCHSRNFEGNGSAVICEAWLQFEREHGTLEDLERALAKAGQRLEELQVIQQAKEAKDSLGQTVKPDRRNQENLGQASKRKRGKDVKEEKKRQKMTPKRETEKTREKEIRDEHKTEKKEDSAARQEDSAEGKQEAAAAAEGKEESANQFRKSRIFTDELTAFLSNIDQDLVEKDIREFFADCGGLKGVRLLRDRNTKRSRGLAYIDFESESSLAAAIGKNRTKLGNRKVSVARSKPTKAKPNQEDGGVKGPHHRVKPLGWQDPQSKPMPEETLSSNQEFRKAFLKK